MADKDVLCVPRSRYVIMEQFILQAGLPSPVKQVSPKLYQLTQQAISNVLVARPLEIDLGFIPTPYTYGKDPIPTAQLYGNPQAEFVSFGMITPLIAVAIYDPANGSLESPPARKRSEAIRGMLAQPDPAASGP
ncbi:MAG: hypothetical protein FIA97_15785 [Methylococcaceae bacterium]|nr:hypothetical protein [Methylococcaceae bacterium]